MLLTLFFLASLCDLMAQGRQLSVGIVGGGLGGLATAVRFSIGGHASRIRVYDIASGPGIGGASAVAAGLLHPFTPRGRLIYKGLEGFFSTRAMLDLIQERIPNHPPLYRAGKSIVRPFFDQSSLSTWTQAVDNYPKWLKLQNSEQFSELSNVNSSPALGAVVMENTLSVDTPEYLRGLWKVVQSFLPNSADWKCESFTTCSQVEDLLNDHDIVIVAAGVGVSRLWPGEPLDFKYVRGQNLIFPKIPSATAHLENSLLCGEYVIPRESDILAGATHEYDTIENLLNTGSTPNSTHAEALLRDSLHGLYPLLDNIKPIGCQAGVRVVSQRSHFGKLPVISSYSKYPDSKYPDRMWLLTGFGSRGMIHHALMADILVCAATQSSNGNSKIPPELFV